MGCEYSIILDSPPNQFSLRSCHRIPFLVAKQLERTLVILSIVGVITPFLFATTGILIIIRKESPRPGLSSITGWPAVVSGIIPTIVFGLMGMVMLIDVILRLIK